jgi:hypothetical protein
MERSSKHSPRIEASAAVVSLLGTLPRDGAHYANVQEVWPAAGGAVEGRT